MYTKKKKKMKHFFMFVMILWDMKLAKSELQPSYKTCSCDQFRRHVVACPLLDMRLAHVPVQQEMEVELLQSYKACSSDFSESPTIHTNTDNPLFFKRRGNNNFLGYFLCIMGKTQKQRQVCECFIKTMQLPSVFESFKKRLKHNLDFLLDKRIEKKTEHEYMFKHTCGY